MKREPPSSMVATSDAYVEPTQVGEDELERIRALGDGSASPDDIYPFRMVASGDGLDFYFTRQHPTSLNNYVRDLQHGQSVLGSHDTGTFSYGQSYDADLVNADPTAEYYEAAFYRQFRDDPELATQHVVVGKYYLVRGVELNGQKTDDLIRAMRLGALRKASISFTVGKYECGVCGRDMMSFMGHPFPNDDECDHFPGVEYNQKGERSLAWAWMMDNDLLETSIVYKNASPSAMLVRKAEELARRGLLPTKEVGRLEERLNVRLPRHDRTHWPVQEEMMGKEHQQDPPEGTEEDPTEGQDPAEGETPPEGEVTEEVTETVTETVTEEVVEETEPTENERSLSAQVRTIETRDAELVKVLGGPLTVSTIRSLKERADLGNQLFEAQVDEVVKARTKVQGERFDSVRYKNALMASGDIEFLMSELTSWDGQTRELWKAGRSVEPDPVPEDKAPPATREEGAEDEGILASVVKQRRKAK